MSITIREGFQVFNEGSRVEALAIESERIPEYMEYFQRGNIKKLFISSVHGFKLKDVSFVENYSFITDIYIYSFDIDYSSIHALGGLSSLVVSVEKKGRIDFSFFPHLKVVFFSWKHAIKSLDSCKMLTEAHVRGYKSAANNLSGLPVLETLTYLELIQSQISSLHGLNNFPRLNRLELHYLSKLASLQGVEESSATLTELFISKSKKISDHAIVQQLQKLKLLAFNDCGEIHSLEFIRRLSMLRDFRFVNTNIKNGDLSACIGLDNVGFLYRKHYSHTPEQFKKEIND